MKVLNSWGERQIAIGLLMFMVLPVGAGAAQTVDPASTPAPVAQQTTASDPQAVQTTPQNPESAPIGTAAAPYEKQEGVTASKPSGEAIAPGKQRRNHSFAIRVGLLIGAAAAIGIVTAASLGSSSRPN